MNNIRNFCIIAHIDAGKSTLADRLMELTLTVESRLMKEQLLDSNPIERERGITIKMAPVSMAYQYEGQKYLLNLIDTPGHVDFNYEVERALQACEGAILLIDATKGVQAQTVANLRLAQNLGLTIVPAVNKIDANLADVDSCIRQTQELLPGKEILQISAKNGLGVEQLLQEVIKQIPAPQNLKSEVPRALIFNSTYHPHLGVIAFVRIVEGEIVVGKPYQLLRTKLNITPNEIGVFSPSRVATGKLDVGQVGYVVTTLKEIKDVQVGDTISFRDVSSDLALPGYRHVRPNVYFDVFPIDNSQYQDLIDALGKLKLNDAALETKPIKSLVLGQGIRVGFLGLLHSEVVTQRLELEFNLPVVATSPSVEYQALMKSGETISFNTASEFPDPVQTATTSEPIAAVQIVVSPDYLGAVLDTCQELRGSLINMTYLDKLVELEYFMPLIEVITSLHDRLKSASSGFASLNYEPAGWQEAELVKLSVYLNHEEASPLATVTIKEKSLQKARSLAQKLKEAIPRQQFEIPVQVSIGGTVIARETVKAFRKDVTAKLYGGDRTRRLKLLEKQKEGKKRMKMLGKVALPQEAFLAAVRSGQEN